MSATPLFVPDLATLLARLRLTGIATSGQAVVDEAVQTVRVGIYRALGAAVVSTLLATTSTLSPITDAELERCTAERVEVAWTRMLLLRSMPVLFKESSSNIQQAWNEEGLARDASARMIADEIERLQADIDTWLGTLTDDSVPFGVRATVIGGTCANTAPGSAIYTSTSSGECAE